MNAVLKKWRTRPFQRKNNKTKGLNYMRKGKDSLATSELHLHRRSQKPPSAKKEERRKKMNPQKKDQMVSCVVHLLKFCGGGGVGNKRNGLTDPRRVRAYDFLRKLSTPDEIDVYLQACDVYGKYLVTLNFRDAPPVVVLSVTRIAKGMIDPQRLRHFAESPKGGGAPFFIEVLWAHVDSGDHDDVIPKFMEETSKYWLRWVKDDKIARNLCLIAFRMKSPFLVHYLATELRFDNDKFTKIFQGEEERFVDGLKNFMAMRVLLQSKAELTASLQHTLLKNSRDQESVSEIVKHAPQIAESFMTTLRSEKFSVRTLRLIVTADPKYLMFFTSEDLLFCGNSRGFRDTPSSWTYYGGCGKASDLEMRSKKLLRIVKFIKDFNISLDKDRMLAFLSESCYSDWPTKLACALYSFNYIPEIPDKYINGRNAPKYPECYVLWAPRTNWFFKKFEPDHQRTLIRNLCILKKAFPRMSKDIRLLILTKIFN